MSAPMTRKELITILLDGNMDDVMAVVNKNDDAGDEEAAAVITQVASTDDGNCYLYYDGEVS